MSFVSDTEIVISNTIHARRKAANLNFFFKRFNQKSIFESVHLDSGYLERNNNRKEAQLS